MSVPASEATRSPPSAAMKAKASQTYARQSRELLEERWILQYLPLVRHVVNKVAGNLRLTYEIEDLISAGTLGLVKAARAFDPGRDSEFKTYAYIRIRGAVLDELRGRSFAPSSVHSQVRRAAQAYQALLAETGSPPSDEQLAERLGVPPRQLYRTLTEARKQRFLSIHGLDDEGPALTALVPSDRSPRPDAVVERKELLAELATAIRQLPKRHRLVLLLYYERDLTMKEVAQVLEITESRVSQIHASALFKLSMMLKRVT